MCVWAIASESRVTSERQGKELKSVNNHDCMTSMNHWDNRKHERTERMGKWKQDKVSEEWSKQNKIKESWNKRKNNHIERKKGTPACDRRQAKEDLLTAASWLCEGSGGTSTIWSTWSKRKISSKGRRRKHTTKLEESTKQIIVYTTIWLAIERKKRTEMEEWKKEKKKRWINRSIITMHAVAKKQVRKKEKRKRNR